MLASRRSRPDSIKTVSGEPRGIQSERISNERGIQLRSLRLVLVIMLGGLSQVNAASVLLGTTSIGFNASGSPNSISGQWTANALELSTGVPIDYFTVELMELTGYANVHRPTGINFTGMVSPSNGAFIALCFNPVSCPIDTYIGSIATIYADSEYVGSPRSFLDRLVSGAPTQVTSGPVIVSWEPPFPINVGAGGTVLVSAYGVVVPAVVPIPAAAWLLGSALGVVGVMRQKATV